MSRGAASAAPLLFDGPLSSRRGQWTDNQEERRVIEAVAEQSSLRNATLRIGRQIRWSSFRRDFVAEGGFTIIEASIAMLVVALMFTALSAGLISGLRATRDARLYQQATSHGEEAVEKARDLPYDTLVMQTSDLSGDPRVQSGPKFDPDQSGPLAAEPIVTSTTGGSIVPHITTEVIGNTTFTTSRYVTWVDDTVQGGPAQSYKRMVVMIEWQVGGRTNNYVTSAFIALARRGLPVPKFDLEPEAQTVEVEQGNLVVLPHTIRNLGIVDTYDLEIPSAENPRGWVINFYKDEGQIGTFEPVTDSLLLDTNSTGKPDTGSVSTNEITYFLVVFLLGPTETPGTVNMTLRAISGANDSVSHTAEDTVIVGFAGLTLNLHNNPSPPTGDTTAQKPMAMNLTPVSGTSLYKYSTNHYTTQPGRFIDRGNAVHTETSTQYMANWVYQVPQNTLFSGTVELKLWVAPKDLDCSEGAVTLRAFLRTKTTDLTDAGSRIASGDGVMVPAGVVGSCPFQQVTITMALTNVNVPINTWLELKVTNRNTSGDAALIAYDTTDRRSTIKLPQVSSS
jgi:type II secretory pathway pseudopilin PulG